MIVLGLRSEEKLMAKDEDTGIDAVSKDGEGASEDELARRRAAAKKAAAKKPAAGSSASRAALEEEQRRLDAEDEKGEEPETGEDDDGQMFVWEKGRRVTLGTLIGRGTPVEHAFVFGGRRSKGRGGLMGFGEKPLMIVRGGVGPVRIVPTYDADENVKSVVVEQHIDAKIVHNADSEDGLGLIAHILDERGYVQKPAAA
jgi:hypothetical protein